MCFHPVRHLSLGLQISSSIHSIYITSSSICPLTNPSKHPSLHLSIQSSTVSIYLPIYSSVSLSFFLCILPVDLTTPPSITVIQCLAITSINPSIYFSIICTSFTHLPSLYCVYAYLYINNSIYFFFL